MQSDPTKQCFKYKEAIMRINNNSNTTQLVDQMKMQDPFDLMNQTVFRSVHILKFFFLAIILTICIFPRMNWAAQACFKHNTLRGGSAMIFSGSTQDLRVTCMDDKEEFEHEGMVWTKYSFKSNLISFTAFVPNYIRTCSDNGNLTIYGKAEKNVSYFITILWDEKFSPIKSIEDYVNIIKNANPDCDVVVANFKLIGAKYAVDLIQKDNSCFYRFLRTDNCVIQMQTNDNNANRKYQFFDLIRIE